jgi:hypothetical protein
LKFFSRAGIERFLPAQNVTHTPRTVDSRTGLLPGATLCSSAKRSASAQTSGGIRLDHAANTNTIVMVMDRPIRTKNVGEAINRCDADNKMSSTRSCLPKTTVSDMSFRTPIPTAVSRLAVPGGQAAISEQASHGLERPRISLWVPRGQRVHVDWPTRGLFEPAGHGKQASLVSARVSLNVPASHGTTAAPSHQEPSGQLKPLGKILQSLDEVLPC